MTPLDTIPIGSPLEGAEDVAIDRVDAELNARVQMTQLDAKAPVRRVRMSNLIIFCNETEVACSAELHVPEIVGFHPARVTLLVALAEPTGGAIRASVLVRKVRSDPRLVSEQVTLRAGGSDIDNLPFAVRSLLIGDLPTNLWWASTTPPPVAGRMLGQLADSAQQLIYDSRGWLDPNRAMASASTWLDRFERDAADHGRWRIASDVNWRRLKTWRRLLTQGLDPATAKGILGSVAEITIEHGPHAVTQAWLIAGWLASRLGWRYQASHLRDNVEIAFQFRAEHGFVTLRIDRVPDGPSAIRRIRVSAGFEGQGGVLEFTAEDNRLMVRRLDRDVEPRTVALSPDRIGELVGRQLSDREPDAVFRQSMRVAEQLARHLIDAPEGQR